MKEFYTQFITPGDLCFDVGANIGNRTKIFLSLGAKVIAFEPQEDCLRVLRKGFKNNPNLTVSSQALGSEEGDMEFFLADGNTISSFSLDWINSVKRSGRFAQSTWSISQLVKMTTLDKIIDDYGIPSFIKLDVEGYESKVLEGLSRPVKFLSMEFTPEYRENTDKSLSHLSKIGDICVNFSIGESLRFVFQNWTSVIELNSYLDKFIDNSNIWGDIYIKYN